MMEFYSESKYKSQEKHICELCGCVINVGDYYYSEQYYLEREKFEVEFFSRDLHIHCHNMMQEFCNKVDNEFALAEITDYIQEEIIDYIQEEYCSKCKQAACLESWEECGFYVTECPKLIKQFSDKEDNYNV